MVDASIRCSECQAEMSPVEGPLTPPKGGPVFHIFECPNDGCKRRAALIFEPIGGMTDDERSWVEREVARRGSFFPSDQHGRRGRFS